MKVRIAATVGIRGGGKVGIRGGGKYSYALQQARNLVHRQHVNKRKEVLGHYLISLLAPVFGWSTNVALDCERTSCSPQCGRG